MMPFDQHSVNTCVLRTTASAFEDLVEVGKIAMVVALGPATLAPRRASCTSFLPLIVKDRFANLFLLFFFAGLSRVTIFNWIRAVLRYDYSALRRWVFLRRLGWSRDLFRRFYVLALYNRRFSWNSFRNRGRDIRFDRQLGCSLGNIS